MKITFIIPAIAAMLLLGLLFKYKTISYSVNMPYQFRTTGNWDGDTITSFNLDLDYAGSVAIIKGTKIEIKNYYLSGYRSACISQYGTIKNGVLNIENIPNMYVSEDDEGNILCYHDNQIILKFYRE